MNTQVSDLSFYVKVEGDAYSSRRNPKGIYGIDVIPERTPLHSACAARNVAWDTIPFLNDDPSSFVLRVFNSKGNEIFIPRQLNTMHDMRGKFKGRTKNHPVNLDNIE